MKNTLTKSFLIAGLLLAGFGEANAVKEFQPAHLVLTDGKQLSGLLDYGNWRMNPKSITFKHDAASPEKELTTEQVVQFQVANEKYVRACIIHETSSDKLDKLSKSAEPEFGLDTTFLETLVEGPRSLYVYRGSADKHQFYVRTDTGFVLLEYKKYLQLVKSSFMVLENRRYLAQLQDYFSDCPDLGLQIINAKYAAKDMVRLFERYYALKTLEPVFKRKADGIRASVRILAGGGINTLAFKSDAVIFDYLTQSEIKPQLYPRVGISFDFLLPRTRERLSFCNDLSIEYIDFKTRYQKEVSTSDITTVDWSLSAVTATWEPYMKYKFVNKSWVAFVGAGAYLKTHIWLKDQMHKQRQYYDQNLLDEGWALYESKQERIEMGLLGCFGVQKGPFSLEGRLSRSMDMTPILVLGMHMTRLSLLFGYTF